MRAGVLESLQHVTRSGATPAPDGTLDLPGFEPRIEVTEGGSF